MPAMATAPGRSCPTRAARKAQAGFTLVELLVALAIGTLVITGATQLFIASQKSYRVQTALATLQDTGRFALDTLARELRHADFKSGCTPSQTTVHVRGPGASRTPAPGLQGFGSVRDLALHDQLVGPLEGTQSIAFRAAPTHTASAVQGGGALSIEQPVDDQQLGLSRALPDAFSDRLVLLQGLQNCDVFFNTARQANRLEKREGAGALANLAPARSRWSNKSATDYLEGQSVALSALDSALYYLGYDPDFAGAPSLMRLDTSHSTPRNEVLASHVAALRARFLVDGVYQPPQALTLDQWERVSAVRISLIVQSERDDLRRSATTITTGNFREAPFYADDGRLYQAFTTTITLRNRP